MQERRIVDEDAIPEFPQPVIILGDPGLGKSVLTDTLGALPNMRKVRAGTFIRTARPETLIGAGERIIVDGLDEIASASPGGGVHVVLSKLSEMDYPPIILSCREADWRGAADRIKISDDYGADPVLLHLQPFDWDDALAFLENRFPSLDPHRLLEHLAHRGLDGVYQNPLTLRLFAEVAHQQESLPDSRAEILKGACAVMLIEENPHHHDAPHAHHDEEDHLLAAGAICAMQLLCDRTGVFTGATASTPDGAVHVSRVETLPFGHVASDVLRTRLFQAEGERLFTHVHRVVAEYLGAGWLARCAAEGRSERRMFGLFRPGDGIPTSLRGLHAWLGHFDVSIANRCIAADPYGVLRYGDAQTIGLEQARVLLEALKNLSKTDPYFASEDWVRHPASGLIRHELTEEILAILTAPEPNLHLFVVVTSAMVGTDLARDVAGRIQPIVVNCDRSYDERSCAADVLRASGFVDDWDSFVRRLLELGDSDSAHIACELLTEIGAGAVPLETGIDVVLSYLRISVSDAPRTHGLTVRDISGQLFFDLETAQLIALLDVLACRAEPLVETANHSGLAELGDLVRRLMVRILEAGAAIAPERLWTWIRWLDGHAVYDEHVRRRLAELLGHGKPLRTLLLEYVLLTPCAENTWTAAHQLNELGLELSPSHEDVASLLRVASDRAGDAPIDIETCRDLFTLGATHEGPAAPVRRAAIEIAREDPVVRGALASRAEVGESDWKVTQHEQVARAEAERQRNFKRHRDRLSGRLDKVVAGNVNILQAPADAYLGRWVHELDRDTAPHERIHEFLGEALANHVLEGFIAVLNRSDLPSASDIAKIHAENRYHVAERPMFCGIAELLRHGRPLDALGRDTLATAYAAWQRWPGGAGNEGQIDIGPALEEVLFPDEGKEEDHFRTSIEPQLAAGLEHVEELSRLLHEDRWASLAARLSVEWLLRFPDLPLRVQTRLVSCAVDREPDELRRQVDLVERIDGAPNPETRLLWLSATFVADFEHHRDALRAAAVDAPNLIWPIRDRFGESEEVFAKFSIDQVTFVVESFGEHWKNVPTTPGLMMGNQNSSDASRFIGRAISAIANRSSPKATEALQRLIDGPGESYADSTKHALALQRKARRDAEYVAPSVRDLESAMRDGVPDSIDGMRAYLLDQLESLQEKIRASNTNMWQSFWVDDNPRDHNYRNPRPECFCRDRLVEYLWGLVPTAIQIEPEARMPEDKRTDFVLSRDELRLPIEIKGQWHREVWDAASEQLDAYYAREWRADGRGVYIVFWFGAVPNKNLPGHPEGLARTDSPEELRQMLTERIPELRRSQIDVFVMDVSPPVRAV